MGTDHRGRSHPLRLRRVWRRIEALLPGRSDDEAVQRRWRRLQGAAGRQVCSMLPVASLLSADAAPAWPDPGPAEEAPAAWHRRPAANADVKPPRRP